MDSLILQELLGRVKDKDIDVFNEKMTKKEEELENRLHLQGLQNIDDIVYKERKKQLEEAVYISGEPLEEPKTEESIVEQDSDQIYKNFLDKLKG